MQKENKIKVLETKLGEKSGGGATIKILDSAQQTKTLGFKNSQQRLVSGGKIQIPKENAEKALVEGIRKRPILEDSPVSVSKPILKPPIPPSPLQEDSKIKSED